MPAIPNLQLSSTTLALHPARPIEQAHPGARHPVTTADEAVSPGAAGFAIFAGILMIMSGTLQALQGLAAIVEDQFFVVTGKYAFEFDVTAWGWIHQIGRAHV